MTRRTQRLTTTAESVLEIDVTGTKRWAIDGVIHREDGPAIERASGTREWWLHGQRHREDGPAIEPADGTKPWWYRHGQLHRDDGPAMELPNGAKYWYRHGRIHREDGPAVEWTDGTKQWWLNGQYNTKPEWLREVLKDRPLTTHQRELLLALSENWAGTPELLYETVTHLAG